MNIQKYKRPLIALVAMVVLACSVNVMADNGDGDGHDDGFSYREAAAMMRSHALHQVTLLQLLEIAEKTSGGVAIETEVEDESGTEVLEVTLLRDTEVITVTCSLVTGKVISTQSSGIFHNAVALLTSRYEWLKTSKVGLAEATKVAEEHEGGIAYHASIEEDSGWTSYAVKVLSNKQMVKLVVDPKSGLVAGRSLLVDEE